MDPVPRYPNEIGLIRMEGVGSIPIVAIEPDHWPGAEGFLITSGEGAEASWRFQDTEQGKAALLEVTDPDSDLHIRLAFDGWDRNEKDVLFAAARTGWLAITSVERFEELTEVKESSGVATLPVRRSDLHEFLTA